MWDIYVFDMDLADVEYVCGGWQLYYRTSCEEWAKDMFSMLEQAHGENVMMFGPGEFIDDPTTWHIEKMGA